jgi:CheY-like chemotaxis protein
MTQVLIVDDDEAARASMRMVLEYGGYEVVEASDGRQAKHYLRPSHHRLIVILDKNVPSMGGQVVLEAVRADPAPAKRHCIILVSAHVGGKLSERLSALLTALSVERVDKPFDVNDLFDAVTRAAQRCQASSGWLAAHLQ